MTMFFITAATLLAAIQVVNAQGLVINTLSNPVACEPVQFTWSGGTPPYYVALIPGGQPSAPAIEQFPVQNGNSMTWTVNLPPNTAFTTSLKDSTGAQAYSDSQTVQSGPDTSCVGQTGAPAPAPSASGPATAPATSGAGVASASAGTSAPANKATTSTGPIASAPHPVSPTTVPSSSGAPATGVHAAGTSTTSTSSAHPSSSNGATLRMSAGAVGIAGLLGLAGAALLG